MFQELLLILCFIKGVQTQICRETFQKSITREDITKLQSKLDGDYIIQNLMSLTDGGKCEKLTAVGLFRIYAVKFSIDRINEDEKLLPNISLGYEVFDGCLSVPVTMARGIDIVRDYRQRECESRERSCKVNANKGENIAVIGAYYSYMSLPLASLLSLHNIPQISYGSSSPLLSKKSQYSSFYRTISSDRNQVDVFIDILKFFGWSYVFVVAADDDYGKLAVNFLKQEAAVNKICFAGDMYIPRYSEETRPVAQRIVTKLKTDDKAKVVIMFGYVDGMADILLDEAEKVGLRRYWLTSEGWNPHILRSNVSRNQLTSVLTISLVKGQVEEFIQYMTDLFTNVGLCDHWVKYYIENYSNCSFSDNSTRCSPNQTHVLERLLEQDPNQVSNLIDATYAIAHGINVVLNQRCPNKTSCKPKITVEELTEGMNSVNFTGLQGTTVSFDSNGDLRGATYSIENVQYINGSFRYRKVGFWDYMSTNRLHVNKSEIVWPDWFKQNQKSECGRRCSPGEYIIGKTGCCWLCRVCEENHFSNATNSEQCYPCNKGYHTKNNIQCLETKLVHLNYRNSVGAIVVSIGVIGFVLTVIVTSSFFFLKSKKPVKDTPNFIVLASFLILLGKIVYVPLFLSEPSTTSCMLQQMYGHFDVILSVALLLVQNKSSTNFSSKFFGKNKNDESLNQAISYFLIILVQIVLITTWCATNVHVVRYSKLSIDQIFMDCHLNYTVLKILLFSYPALILVLSTVIAFSEREHGLDKFNENRLLNYCCLSSCILMLAQLVVVEQVRGEYIALVLCLTLNGYGYVYVLCVLAPKVYYAITTKEPDQSCIVNNACDNKAFGDSSK